MLIHAENEKALYRQQYKYRNFGGFIMDITFDEKIAKQAGCAHIDNLCNKAKQAIIAEKTVII